MSETVSIAGIPKPLLLKALWEHSRAQGFSFLGLPTTPPSMDTFQSLVDSSPDLYFDYVLGHVIKCDLSKDDMPTFLYDRDCGKGACERAVQYARSLMP